MSERPPLTRRELFTAWRRAAPEPEPPAPRLTAASLLPPYLRPPGALEEGALIATCERCHKCAQACPHDVILPLGPAYGAAEGTPAVMPRGGPCRLCEDLPCARACPSGALRPIPLHEVRMGTARLEPGHCWAVRGQPCDYCVKECPLGERALRWNGDRPEVVVDGCVGCGLCAHICTATPSALRIDPAHREALGPQPSAPGTERDG